MKRLLALACALALLTLALPAAAVQFSGDWAYIIINGGACVVGYSGGDREMNIPAKLGGYPVTAVSDGVFVDLPSLEVVSMPDTLETLGAGNFVRCGRLHTVYLSSRLYSSGAGCFEDCVSLRFLLRDGIPVTVASLLYGAPAQQPQPPSPQEDLARRARALSHYFIDGKPLPENFASGALPVYSGPGTDYYRAAGGKAAASTSRRIYSTYYALRHNSFWLLIIYGTSGGGSRYGWIEYKKSFGFNLESYSNRVGSMNDRWFNDSAVTARSTPIYDYTDPAMGAVTTLPAGTSVIYFALRGGLWAYVEAATDLGLMRGFVDVNDLVF